MVCSTYTFGPTLSSIRESWEDLALNASERNIFFERWMLEPAFQYLNDRGDAKLLAVWRDKAQSDLIGVLPIIVSHRYRKIPINFYSTWRHIHCFLGTPLFRKGAEELCAEEIFVWLDQSSDSGPIFEFQSMNSSGPVCAAIRSVASSQRRMIDETEHHDRALLVTGLDYDSYIKQKLKSKRIKDLRRKESQLKELGDVGVRAFQVGTPLSPWFTRFTELEASGWKGAERTALLYRENEQRYFEEICNSAEKEGKVSFIELTLNGQPIAAKCNLRSGDGSYAFKVAYDESYSRFSPGILLELENMKQILSDSSIEFMDSCAAPAHEATCRIWKERRTISSLAISRNSLGGRLIASTMPIAKGVYESILRPKRE